MTEGALLAALTVLVALLVVFFGSVGLVAAPLPLFVLTYRRGVRVAVLSAVVAGFALSPLFGFPQGLLFVAAFAPMGIIQGAIARRGGSAVPARALAFGVLGGLVVTALSLAAARVVLGLDPLQTLVEAQVRATQSAATMLARMNAPPAQVQQMEALAEQLPAFLRMVFPAALVLGVVLWAYGAYALARQVMRRLGTDLPGFAPILTWRLPPAAGAAIALPVLVGVAIQPLAPSLGRALTANAFLVGVMVFAFLGVLTMLYYLNARDVPRGGRVLAVVAVILLGDLGTFAMAILGLLDLWFDLRKIGPRAPQSAQETEQE
ncbi:MAG: DUF2232 domain-containing protein [Armatimonadota bacterium]|nr:DUF2232 domain-containing protein [Armatimonadota bacterium]MDR5696771.1 DUF2232 domain-containing protein [Armatimonadota bacterium]